MPNQKKRRRRTGGQDRVSQNEQGMSKRLRSNPKAVEVVQLASDSGTPPDAIMSTCSNKQKHKSHPPSQNLSILIK